MAGYFTRRHSRRYFLSRTILTAIFPSQLIPKVLAMVSPPQLLTDPFLQLPTETSVRVVWFTEFVGSHHVVTYGENLGQTAIATTTQLSRTREDQDSQLTTPYSRPTYRPIWRHEAKITGLLPGQPVPYQVTSTREDGVSVSSDRFTLSASPAPGQPLKIWLTSDHQLKPMVAANCQKVWETVGQVDAVLFAGDLVNVPDRASEWFDDRNGNAFFPPLQGRAHYDLEKNGTRTRYTGGALIQSAPLFAAIGNHEVMGRFSTTNSLDDQFEDAVPRWVAEKQYQQIASTLNPTHDPAIRTTWLKDHSFNVDTYQEILTLPASPQGGETYYAVTFGDIRLIVLYITNIWRTYQLTPDARGRYRERDADLNQPDQWGYGQHIFEPIAKGSPQYTWLEQELSRPEFQQAKYRIVMFHHPPHTLGDNIVPAYTDPVQKIDQDAAGTITAIRYEYPKSADYIARDVVPLLEAAGTHLVFFGHSHLWNRFVSPKGTHYLETSNVGNSYGAYLDDRQRPVPPSAFYQENYVATGDPNGLDPIIPTIAPLRDASGQPMPYIASNDITVFSILDTGAGTVSSYYFDTRNPESAVVKFDQFSLLTSAN
ncbi:metallophosphoesterase family protein [Leptothermofonsia sichuanensis]|uniref:metallophosphoesterase family protein n=1 Tax=Leptothermofonsia sichuanensis TaxID=2917832 RepID=UPI001EF0761B